jgi:superfamily I DNA and/or RNA helicase
VDNFQGDERSIVIVSLVRSTKDQVGEFPRIFERINVAMSRAQQMLIVLGALRTFRDVNVPLPSPDGSTRPHMCYAHILDVIRRYAGLRNMGEIF